MKTGRLYKISFSGSSSPVIYQQPASVLVAKGETATFEVDVTGTEEREKTRERERGREGVIENCLFLTLLCLFVRL